MPPSERLFNILLALSALTWAILGIALAEPTARWTPPRLAISLFNSCVAALFLIRAPLTRSGSPGLLAAAIPSLVLGGVALKLAPSPENWTLHGQILLVAGLAWAAVSFIALGRSFALLPAVRSIVTGGPFRLIRHPAYLGEFLAILGCGLASTDPMKAWPAAAAVPLILVRILAEEHALRSAPEYEEYCRNVRWRLIPGVW